MKKITKLLFSLTSSLLVASNVLAMTACGEETVSGVTTADVPVTAYNGEEVTISFYHCMGAALRDILTDGIADFNKIYPNIKVLSTSFGDYPGVRDQISTELASERAPSLAYCYPDHVALYNKSNTVLPLDAWISSTATASNGDLMGMTAEQVADYNPTYWGEGKIYDEAGTMYTLPMLKSTELLYYNKTYFEENNLKVPETWDEMEQTCAKIMEIEAAKEAEAKKTDPNAKRPCIPLGYDSGANWFITMTEQLNSGYTTAEKGNYFTFNNETNREFVQRFRSWYEKQYVTTEETYGSYTSELFTQVDPAKTKCFMCIGSSAGAGYQTPALMQDGKTYPFELGIAMIPQQDTVENLEAAGKKPTMISQGPSICLFKKQDAQEVAAAWLFAKYITSNHKFQAKCSMNNGYTPAVLSITENSTYKTFLDNANKGNKYSQAAAVNLTLAMKDYYFVSPAFNGSSAARDKMAELLKNSFRQMPSGVKAEDVKGYNETQYAEYQTKVSTLIKELFDDAEKELKRKYDK